MLCTRAESTANGTKLKKLVSIGKGTHVNIKVHINDVGDYAFRFCTDVES